MRIPVVPTLLRSWWMIAAAIVALLVGAYAFVGYRVLPGWVRDQAISQVREIYGRELTVGQLRIDPFRLQAEVRDLMFPDADGAPMLGWRRLDVDLEAASLWRRAWVFRLVTLEAPLVRAVLRNDGALNLADLAISPAGAEPQQEDATLPRLWIRDLEVTAGTVAYVEQRAPAPDFESRYAPVAFSLQDLRTTGEDGEFHLSARSQDDERFDWSGRFQVAPQFASQGSFSIAGLQAAGIADYLGERFPLQVSRGLIELAGSYDLALTRPTRLLVQVPGLSLTRLALRPRGGDADWIEAPSVTLSDLALDLGARGVTVQTLQIAQPAVKAWWDGEGVNLARLVASAPPADADTDSDAASAWTLSLAEFAVSDGRVDFEDRREAPAKPFVIAPLNATARNLGLDMTQALPVTLSARINDAAQLEVSGNVTPEPLAAGLDVQLRGARLAILQPYVLPLAQLTIRSGTLSTDGHLALQPAGETPAFRYEGDMVVDGLRSVDNHQSEDLFNFRQLRLRQLNLTTGPDMLRIGRIDVREPYARLIVGADGVLNVTDVLDPQGAAEQRAARAEQEAQEAAQPRRRERGGSAQREESAPSPPVPEPEGEIFPVRIGEVLVERGRLDFADHNIRPNFAADIQSLSGSLKELSSARDSRATVDLAGNLGEFSPVTIGGTIQPFAFDRHTDIKLKFGNISLPVFNPYSGQLAGYNISRGSLTTDLHYQITDRALEAGHNIRIDQLEWGEASEFRGEATLPVKFATVLLRDRHGVINLDVPVKGTIDDPTFRIGPIVWQIIRNLIVKAVTSPFALLGGLFAGAEEAQFVDFAPGSGTLDAATAGRLAQLAKSLVEKPGISVDVPIGAIAALDMPAVREQRYQQQLASQIEAKLRPRDDEEAAPAFETLTPKQQRDVLVALLRMQGGDLPSPPESGPPPEGTSRAEARALRDEAEIAFYEEQARARVTPGEQDLDRLAQARAEAVQAALLGPDELEPARVFLVREGKVSGNGGQVRLELGLK